MPNLLSTPIPIWTFGFLKSKSSNTTFLLRLKVPAKFKLIKVFPSPEIVDVVAITFFISNGFMNERLLLKDLNDSAIIVFFIFLWFYDFLYS